METKIIYGCSVKSVASIMKLNSIPKVEKVDVMKINIEVYENTVLPELLDLITLICYNFTILILLPSKVIFYLCIMIPYYLREP